MSVDSDDGQRSRQRFSFTREEDERLRQLVVKHGDSDWGHIAAKMPKRDRRQCRERWVYYLSPQVRNGPWTPDEETRLRQKVAELGHRWTSIQAVFPGRTDINIKNHWKQMKKWGAAATPVGPAHPLPQTHQDLGKEMIDSMMFADDGIEPTTRPDIDMLW
jgi:hypothetical protein